MYKKKFWIITVLLALVLFAISGCATSTKVRSDVSVFHDLEESTNEIVFAFDPTEAQSGSLEYRAYVDLVREHLTELGYVEADAQSDATWLIQMEYTIGDGEEKVGSVPIIGQTGTSSSTTYGTISSSGGVGTYSGTTYHTPTFGVVGSSTYSRTVYSRALQLSIAEPKTAGGNDKRVLFEATVSSVGTSSQLSRVMPAMVEALFTEFPGESGATRTVMVPLDNN
jgi:hypothetical protein